MTIEEILSLFKNKKKSGNGFMVTCPTHDDKKPSLKISLGTDGRIVLWCHGHCTTEAVVHALKLEMKDLFPEPPTRIVRLNGNRRTFSQKVVKEAKTQGAEEKIYNYVDASGKVLYQTVRYHPKDFRHRRPDGKGGYIYNLDGVDRVPYHLPQLLDAIKSGDAIICFTEGEKDADTLRSLGFVATSFKKWTESFNSHIEGCRALIFRDHDTSGVVQANDAASIIAKAAKSITIIDLFDGEPIAEKHGKDVSDWIEARRSEGLDDDELVRELATVEERTELYTPDVSHNESGLGLEIEFLSTVKATEISWLAKPLMPFGFFTLLDGIEGIGKTYAMLDIAKRLTLGEPMPFSGEIHHPSKVLFLSVEDSPEYILKPRFEKMQGDCSRLAILRGHFDFSDKGFLDLEQTIETHSIKFVLIDPLFSFTGRADINSTSDVRPITDRLNQLAVKYGIAIVGIRHINKSKGFGDPRNAGAHSVAWVQGCRSALIVGHDSQDKAKRGIGQHKLNVAAETNVVYGFEIDASGVFSWTGVSDLTIAAMLAHKAIETNEGRSAVGDAVRFLKAQLAGGEKLKTDLDVDARGAGISFASLNRAKVLLRIKPRKSGLDGGWKWKLPEDAQPYDEDDQEAQYDKSCAP